MDFKSMLNQLSQLSEATKDTATGRVHKAEPGGYGRKFDTDDEGDEKKEKKPEVKRGRGRPKKGADSDTGQVAKYDNAKDLQSFMIGNVPKKSKELEKLPKKKHSLKEWVQEIEEKYVAEAVPPGMKPMAILDPKNQQAGAGVVTSTNPAVQKMLGSLDPKDTKVVMTTQQQPQQPQQPQQQTAQQGQTTPPPAGSTGQAPVGQAQVKEKWAGDAKIHATGQYSSKSVEELKSMLAKLKKSGPHPEDSPEAKKQRQINFALRAKGGWKKGEGAAQKEGVAEGDIPSDQVDMGAGLGAGRSQATLESKAKPDFLDLDKDGNKKESMKKAAKDKKKVNESTHRHSAARLTGKAHALAKEAYNCKYDDMEEAKAYHDGFKEGLDECYGQSVYETAPITPPATVGGMAQQGAATPAMEDEMGEGNAFTAALARTPKGEKFSVGGKTFTDRTSYDSKIDEFAFESLDKQLNELLNEDAVSEGMTVSISKGQQGMPDTVSVSAQDGEADQLLGLIKQAGLGLFGGEETNGYGAPKGSDVTHAHGDIDVVGDHDGMMSLIKKVTGASDEGSHDHDYEEEEGHSEHEEACEQCGMEDCECDHEEIDEVESYDQEEEEVAEDNLPDSDAAETTADENAEAAEDQALAQADEEQVTEWANDAGESAKDFDDETFKTDMDFMTKVISGGLNKEKSTGQTTIPVIAGQKERMVAHESVADWKKLAGIK